MTEDGHTRHGGAGRGGRPGARSGHALTLSVVVPAFNESSRLDEGLDRLFETFSRGVLDPERTEVVLVDDGSTDDTAARAESLLAPLRHAAVLRLGVNSGKGAAVRAGVATARGPAVAFTDADMSIEPNHLPELVAALDDADVAIGSRSLPGQAVDYDDLARTLMGRAFNRVVNAATNISFDDTQCGFKGFRTPVARLLFHFSVSDRFAFDVGLLSAARRLGLSVAEIPVRWRHVADSRIRPLRDPASMLGDIVRSRSRLEASTPVRGLAVPGGREAVAGVPGQDPHRPVIEDAAGGALVLFPLEADDVAARTRLAAALPESTPVTVSFADLVRRAPIVVTPSRSAAAVAV